MTIALAQITSDSLWVTGTALALVAIGITALLYGSVAMLVKADDVGLRMAQIGRGVATRAIGAGIVKAMPLVLSGIGDRHRCDVVGRRIDRDPRPGSARMEHDRPLHSRFGGLSGIDQQCGGRSKMDSDRWAGRSLRTWVGPNDDPTRKIPCCAARQDVFGNQWFIRIYA